MSPLRRQHEAASISAQTRRLLQRTVASRAIRDALGSGGGTSSARSLLFADSPATPTPPRRSYAEMAGGGAFTLSVGGAVREVDFESCQVGQIVWE